MGKDPAVLFFIDTWLTATKEMKADCRGWYLNLILHQYDKNGLPNDVEELANLADVRVSEYKRFEQVFEQVLKHKFILNTNTGRLENEIAKEILRRREEFKDKRSLAGKISYFLRYARKNLCTDENIIQFVKNKIDFNTFDIKNEQMFEQVFKQTSELYNGIGIGNIYINNNTVSNNNNTVINSKGTEQKKSFNTMPVSSDFNGLPIVYIEKTIESVKIHSQSEINQDTVKSLWEIFKIQYLTGKEHYPNEEKVYNHFMNITKKQKFNNGTDKQAIGTNKHNAGAYQLLNNLKGETPAGRKQDN